MLSLFCRLSNIAQISSTKNICSLKPNFTTETIYITTGTINSVQLPIMVLLSKAIRQYEIIEKVKSSIDSPHFVLDRKADFLSIPYSFILCYYFISHPAAIVT